VQPELGRLLVIDDEQGIADLVSMIATSAGYDTRALTQSAGFENIVLEWAPTVVMLDIVMPDRDGLELIGVLAAINFKGHLVIMSGADPLYSQMAATSAKARGLKVAQPLSKPFRSTHLQDALRRLSAETA
jgi:DNA-binding NtrC family response regulator